MSMNSVRGLFALATIGSIAAIPMTATAVDAPRIAAQGNGNGAAPCQSCHGADGGGQAAAGFPRLAGLDAGYLRAQLDAFAAGTRENAVMKTIAGALSDEEREAMAAYYSKLAPPRQPPAAAPDPHGPGAQLALRGRWSRQVPACEQCHGPGGVGVGQDFPPLVGQPAGYLAAQLRAFRQGTRHNDPLALMRHLSQALDEKDIQAVAAWFAAQPFPPPAREQTR